MYTTGDDIFIIPLGSVQLIYAPLHKVTAVVNAAAAAAVHVAVTTGDSSSVGPSLRKLVDRLLAAPDYVPSKRQGPFSPASLSLVLTNDCNLRCLYCAPSAGDFPSISMPQHICDTALDMFADIVVRDELPTYSLYFQGGEPTLCWDMLTHSVRRGRRIADDSGVPFRASATTNGFYSLDKAQWLADNFDYVIVSHDGPPDMHDRLRVTPNGVGSFETVDRTLRIFEDEGLPYGLGCTIDQHSQHHIPEIATYLCEQYTPHILTIDPVIQTGRCARSGVRPPQPEVFIEGVKRAGEITQSHGVRLRLSTADVRRLGRSNCGLADDRLVVCPDGGLSGCGLACSSGKATREDPYRTGEYSIKECTFEIDYERLEYVRGCGVEAFEDCRQCFCKWHCQGGCPILGRSHRGIAHADMCTITRELTLWQICREYGISQSAQEVTM